MIRTLIIDDELHARDELHALLSEVGGFDVLASCGNAIDALKQINLHRPEVIFLDIQMPVIDGFELLSMIDPERMPHVIFVTAYDEFALKAFEEKTLDYLLKPIALERLEKAVAKLKDTLRDGERSTYESSALLHVPCLRNNRIKLITPRTITHVHSSTSGVHVVTDEGEFYTELTLKVLEDQTELLRCHKQTLVNPRHLDELRLFDNGTGEIILRSGHSLQVSRRYLRQLKQTLNL